MRTSENGADYRRFGRVQGVWCMECFGARQTCRKNGLKRSQERLETDFCTFLVGFQRKVGRVVGRKKWRETGAKEQQSTHCLCMNLLDIISYHIISYHIISHTRVSRGFPVCVPVCVPATPSTHTPLDAPLDAPLDTPLDTALDTPSTHLDTHPQHLDAFSTLSHLDTPSTQPSTQPSTSP